MRVDSENFTLIDELLEEQRKLTAVEKFSQRHSRQEIPLQEKYYRDLIPLTAPKPGEQYAFEVDLDACSGCKACVTACHSLNGLDPEETWRDVGILIGGTRSQPVQKTVTTACHHCVDPGCLNGCPVLAYEKDVHTGIVRHFDDQCIGCQYCVMMCPYDVPKYSKERGIIRKCDMCYSRLSVGEAPACVQACPSRAITIRIVDKAEAVQLASTREFLPDSPDPDCTKPTTFYKSAQPISNLKAADHHDLQPQPAHWPLVFMLIGTQFSVGLFAVELLARIFASDFLNEKLSGLITSVASGAAVFGLTASVLHLGQPLKAWRSFLGWRRSWLSREILVFGLYTFLACLYAGSSWFAEKLSLAQSIAASSAFSLSLVATGLLGIVCSIMVYHDTRRDFWKFSFSAGRFFGTTILLGVAGLWCASVTYGASELARVTAGVFIMVTFAKLLVDISIFRHLDGEDLTSLQRSALLMSSQFRTVTSLRILAGVMGGLLLPFIFLVEPGSHLLLSASAFTLCIGGELAERFLFFTAVAPKKMPGGI